MAADQQLLLQRIVGAGGCDVAHAAEHFGDELVNRRTGATGSTAGGDCDVVGMRWLGVGGLGTPSDRAAACSPRPPQSLPGPVAPEETHPQLPLKTLARGRPLLLDLIGAEPALVAGCAAAVRGFGTLREMKTVNLSIKPAPDLLLLAMHVPIAEGIAAFAQSRAARASTPVVLLGEELDIDLAMELVRLGASDFVLRSTLAENLLPKLERALNVRKGPVGHPALAALLKLPLSPARTQNRRRCFRARIAGGQATLRLRDGEARFEIEDLSIPTDGWPGGLGLRTDSSTGARLPFDDWQGGESLALTIQAPGEPAVSVSARFVAGSRRVVGVDLHFGLDYVVGNASTEAALRQLWIRGQIAAVRVRESVPLK